jgi:CheY-like chemotaxis protein
MYLQSGTHNQIKDGYDRLADKLTILVAEDYESTRFMMRCFLEMKGYRVIEAKNGLEMVDMALRERPQLILVDVDLPRLNGLKALRRIRRQDEEMRHVPVIVITAHTEAKIRFSAFSAGCRAFITKPFNVNDMEIIIAHFLSCSELSNKSHTEYLTI